VKFHKSDFSIKSLSEFSTFSFVDKIVFGVLFFLLCMLGYYFYMAISWLFYDLFYVKESNFYLLLGFIFLLLVMPLMFIVYSKKILFLLFRIFFKFKSFELKGFDFYTTDKEIVADLYKDDKSNKLVYFVIFPLSSVDRIYKNIQQKYLEFSYFWYATQIDLVKFRFFLPILSFLLSILFFLGALYILDNVDFSQKYNNIVKIALVIVFLIILYLSMITHINMFLNPQFYKNEIYKLFKTSKINFLDSNLSKNILIYFEKNFLIKIFDRKLNTKVTVNNNEDFEKFVLKEDIDFEGKKYIVNIFVFMFMIIYATIFIEVLIDDDVEKVFKYQQHFNISVDDKKHNLSFKKDTR